MSVTGPPVAAQTGVTPIVRRSVTRAGANALELVEWSKRSLQITEPDGTVAFACENVEAPNSWSNLAVAVVARRYFADGPAPERSVRTLVERVVDAIAGWAQEAGHVTGDAEREALLTPRRDSRPARAASGR